MTQRDELRDAAFDFARQLGNPDFRAFLNSHGCHVHQDVVVALDREPVTEVLARVFTRTDPPVIVAIRRPSQRLGFVFLSLTPAIRRDTRPADGEALGSKASIGMLYDHMAATDVSFDPSSWYTVQPLHGELTSC